MVKYNHFNRKVKKNPKKFDNPLIKWKKLVKNTVFCFIIIKTKSDLQVCTFGVGQSKSMGQIYPSFRTKLVQIRTEFNNFEQNCVI